MQKANVPFFTIQGMDSGRKNEDISANFGIAQRTLLSILKLKDAISKSLSSVTSTKHKKLTQPTHEDIEKALCTLFFDMRMKKMPISKSMLQQKVVDYTCLLGIDDFKGRRSLEIEKVC